MAEEFDVCVSYARKNGRYVRRVVDALQGAGLSVYFDVDREAETAGKNLPEELLAVYGSAKRCCLLFLSAAYAKSDWAKQERRSAIARAFKEDGYLIPVRLDRTKLPFLLPDTTWIDARNRAPEHIAHVIIKKITGTEPPPRPWLREVLDYLRYRSRGAIASIAVLLALAGLGAYRLRPSQTSFAFDHPTQDMIVVRVENSGGRPSRLVSSRLKFDGVPVEDTELRMVRTEPATIEPGHSERDFLPVGLELFPALDPATSQPAGKAEILLAHGVATLEVDIAESNEASPRRRSERVPAEKIRPFIERWVPDVP
jgi:hypothetical protein